MIYKIYDLRFDLDRRQLSRDGKQVKLTRLSFRVLRTLVEAAPAVVRHDDLIKRVWGADRIITPENLTQRIKTLRQSLDDDPANPTYIEGIRGQGYRLIPDVTRVQDAPEAAQSVSQSGQSRKFRRQSPHVPGWRGKRLFVLVLAGVLISMGFRMMVHQEADVSDEPGVAAVNTTPAESSINNPLPRPAIAVLPFANLSGDPANAYFTDGIHDDLLTRISNIQDIKTISRTSVMTYRDTNKKLGAIARELGVSTVLEGGVQRIGQQVRINLQLIDAESDAHLWARTFTRELTATNVFAIQAEITEAVANALQTVLSEEERRQLEKNPTENMDALDAFFRGNEFYAQHTTMGFEKAIAAYQAAVQHDPEFAQAYSRQALVLLHQVWFNGFSVKLQLEKSRLLIDQAMLLDPQSGDAYNTLGQWYWYAGDIDKAEQAFKRAMTLTPNDPTVLVNLGNLQKWKNSDPGVVLSLFREAIELDPINPGLRIQLAEEMSHVGLSRDAIVIVEDILTDQPASAGAYRVLAQLYSLGESRQDKAIKAARKSYQLDPNHAGTAMQNAIMHWRLGDLENTVIWLNYVARLSQGSEAVADYRGLGYFYQGDLENARIEFERSVAESNMYLISMYHLGRISMARGNPDEVIERYEDIASEIDERRSTKTFAIVVGAIRAYQARSEQEKAHALGERLLVLIETNPHLTFHGKEIWDAALYLALGEPEKAIATLSEWVNQGGATAYLQELTRFELAVLADDTRYQALLQTVNQRLDEQKNNIDRWEASGEMSPMPTELMKKEF